MDYGTKQTEPLIGSVNSRPPPFNTSDATPPQYSQAPPPHAYAPPPQAYAPPPPNYGGTTANNTNVVVVTQPTYQSSPVVQRPYAPDYLGFSVFMLVCCLLLGSWFALFCIIPALILSIVARDHNQAGRLDEAASSGKVALGCNIAGLVSGVLIVLGILLFVIVSFTISAQNVNRYNNFNYPTNPTSWPNNN